mmetsp:Transcript_14378/g.23733  ORF Transcript_14378/g.23733 Transcript_14378/m.23733 type:complete len:214 (+) Transcript_14378:2528-3169(+)
MSVVPVPSPLRVFLLDFAPFSLVPLVVVVPLGVVLPLVVPFVPLVAGLVAGLLTGSRTVAGATVVGSPFLVPPPIPPFFVEGAGPDAAVVTEKPVAAAKAPPFLVFPPPPVTPMEPLRARFKFTCARAELIPPAPLGAVNAPRPTDSFFSARCTSSGSCSMAREFFSPRNRFSAWTAGVATRATRTKDKNNLIVIFIYSRLVQRRNCFGMCSL